MFVPVHGKQNLANDSIALLSYSLKQKSMFASSAFLLLMLRKNGVFDRDSPEYRATKASKLVLGKISER
jgi:hypothetical protein